MREHSFPTLGEAVQFVFECTGLLAQKHSQSNVLASETAKKTIQTKISRLAKEEGNLEQAISEIILYLRDLILEATQDLRVVNALMEVFNDIYETYLNTLNEEGTYLTKKETVKWFIQYWMSDSVIKAVHKHALMHGLTLSELICPSNIHWWLPKFDDKKIEWPLETAWRWIYSISNTSQSRFHNPNDAEGRAQQNAENASRWFNRGRLPQWGELQENLEFSVQQLTECSDTRYQRTLSSKDIHSIKITLFFARMATEIFQKINNAFGGDFTKKLSHQMQAQNRRMLKFNQNIKNNIGGQLAQIEHLMVPDYYSFWFYKVHNYWQNYSEHMFDEAKYFQKIWLRRNGKPFSFSELKALSQRFDSVFLAIFLRESKREPDDQLFSFSKFYLEGRALRKQTNLSLSDVINYEKAIREKGLSSRLSWLVEWMHATRSYRNEEYSVAYEHYKKTFELSKHGVGKDSYLIANQYAESCAKNNKWSEFKKLIKWANFNNVKIRWHRGFDESDEGAKYAYEILKIANYSV